MPRRFPIKIFDSLPSTNDSILEAGAGDAPEGTTHIARTQTRGRGRGDHTWWSPKGAGLWMSTLLRPPRARAQWGGISIVAGAAVRRALTSLGVRGVDLYWPNDLKIGRRKLGGILGEVRSRGEGAWVALGIGINTDLRSNGAGAAMPAELRGLPICLTEAGPPSTINPLEIAIAILHAFWPLYEKFGQGASIPELVGDGLAHRGRSVEVRVPGVEPWRGIVEGLAADGELLVRAATAAGSPVRAVTGGEVIYDEAS